MTSWDDGWSAWDELEEEVDGTNWTQRWAALWDGFWSGEDEIVMTGPGTGGMPLWVFGEGQMPRKQRGDGEERRKRRKKKHEEEIIMVTTC